MSKRPKELTFKTEFCTDGDTGEVELIFKLGTKDEKLARTRAWLILCDIQTHNALDPDDDLYAELIEKRRHNA
jgi:hypothetical protein